MDKSCSAGYFHRIFCLNNLGQYGFLSYELEDGKKLFFHMSEVKDHQHLNPGDEVEFVILQNPRNGKSSACSVVKVGCVVQKIR